MKLSKEFKEKFRCLINEFAKAHRDFVLDCKGYFREMQRDGIIVCTINALAYFNVKNNETDEGGAFFIHQLHRTKLSLSLVGELGWLLAKSNNYYCMNHELGSFIEGVAYVYINNNAGDFIDVVSGEVEDAIVHFEQLEIIVDSSFQREKDSLTMHCYHFPVNIFGLTDDLIFSKSVKFVKASEIDLDERELELFKAGRTLTYNFFVEVKVNKKCTDEFALDLAKRVRDVAVNLVNLYASSWSPNVVPIFTSVDTSEYLFDFYKGGVNSDSLEKCEHWRFPYKNNSCQDFWSLYKENRVSQSSIINISEKIPEILIASAFEFFSSQKQTVAQILERSLLWYGDAVKERVQDLRILKLVTSLETLVNFKEGNVNEHFVRRVSNLNIQHSGVDGVITEKAACLYKVRSEIVHGSIRQKWLSFDSVEFCSKTLLRALFYFNHFGYEKTNFNRLLPKFIDDIPVLDVK